MGDLHRRCARGRLSIEGEQSVPTEGLQDSVDDSRLYVDGAQLTSGDTPPGVRPPLAELDQPQKHLSDRPAAFIVKVLIQPISRGCDGPWDAAQIVEGRQCQPIRLASVEKFRKRVLKER